MRKIYSVPYGSRTREDRHPLLYFSFNLNTCTKVLAYTQEKANLGVAQWKLESVNKTISELTENIENVNQDTLHHSMTETSSQAPLEGYIKVSVDEVSGLGGWLPVVGMSIVFGLIGVIANTYTYSQIFSDGRWESQQFLVR